jgi:allophanate hydrolase subunit 1
VRGALAQLPGIAKIEVAVGDRNLMVHFDQAKVNTDEILAALTAAGESAQRQ